MRRTWSGDNAGREVFMREVEAGVGGKVRVLSGGE